MPSVHSNGADSVGLPDNLYEGQLNNLQIIMAVPCLKK